MPTESGSGRDLSYCASEIRQYDPDRFATVMLAPQASREDLFSLYAFNLEVAKIREAVSEPMLGEIRLQWWREAIDGIYEGTPRRHEVVLPLAKLVAERGLTRQHFDVLIDARARDLSEDAPASLDALLQYAEGTSANLIWLALETLGIRSNAASAAARHIGIAWALTGLMRAIPFHLSQRRLYLPDELIGRHGIQRRNLMELRPEPAIASAVEEIAALARDHLEKARALKGDIPQAAIPALLLASLADMHLRRLAKVGYDPFDARLALSSRFVGIRLAMKTMAGRY
jgi:NADH dehydrogenase [ubiquinone] 1 alpha subcomplex assembly factor 6